LFSLPNQWQLKKHRDTVDSFNYLGSCITTEGGAERDIKVRIGKARSAFIRLGNIWKTTAFSTKTKLKLYNSCCDVMQVFVGDFVQPEYLHYLSQTGVMEAGESVDVFISHPPAL
jgi:hypothetical protein